MCITIKSITIQYDQRTPSNAHVQLDELGSVFPNVEIPAEIKEKLIALVKTQVRGKTAAFATSFVTKKGPQS